MTFEEKLQMYAELIVVHGLNIQHGQVLNISTEAYHRDLAAMITEVAYQRGAKAVIVDLSDPRFGRLRLQNSADDDLQYVPEYIGLKYRELVDGASANLSLIGPEEPDILTDQDPARINTVRIARHMAVKHFYDEGIGKSKVHWTVAAAATPKWGQKIFPTLQPKDAEAALWEQIFTICRADQPNCLELWREHNRVLQARAKRLTKLAIEELHFVGPGTDLRVRLSDKAIFKGGGDLGPHSVEFEPNIPTEECFTTPDWRGTNGKVKATRPFLINGVLIKGLEMEFNEGLLTSFSATAGEATFREYIGSDEGAKRLGEVALVGIDSPIYKSGLVFEEILYDENAACHIAIGQAYKTCLAGGESMSAEELIAVGCNESTVHTDMMISSDEVHVSAQCRSGERIELLSHGNWCDALDV